MDQKNSAKNDRSALKETKNERSSAVINVLAIKYTPEEKDESKDEDKDENKDDNNLKALRFVKHDILDCCKGRLAQKSKCWYILETLCYVPLWLFLLYWLFIFCLIGSVTYCTVSIVLEKNLTSYGGACLSTSDCNINKGLYCRLNRTSNDACDCPGYSTINQCDCPTSYYWDGIKCASVYSYGNGPCTGDYSCQKGLTCDQTTSQCLCPVLTPLWDENNKVCNVYYVGCFFNCINTTFCDISTSNIVISGSQVELNTCLIMCNVRSYKYAEISTSSGTTRCTCTHTYNKYANQTADTDCSFSCTIYYTPYVARCPNSNTRYSAFQIGI